MSENNNSESSVLVTAEAPVFKEADSSALEKIKSVPSVQLIISSREGRIIGAMGGENSHFPSILREFSQRSETDEFKVDRHEDTLTGLGQDIYSAPRDFVIKTCALMTFLSVSDIKKLDSQLPWDAVYTFIVSY